MPIFGTEDVVRDVILVFYAGVVFYTVFFALVFLAQWLKSPIRRWSDTTISWSVFMIGMALNSFFFIQSDFIFIEEPMLSIMTKSGYVSMMLALVGFFLALERILPYNFRHVPAIAGVVLMIGTIFVPYEYLSIFSSSASLLTFVMLFLFLTFAIRNTSGTVRRSIELISIGFVIGFIGYVGKSDVVYYNLGPHLYLIASVLLLIGLITMGVTVVTSPSLDEIDWYDQLLELYVIHESGLLLTHHKFKKVKTADEDLAAAGITGLQSMFKEILQSDQGFHSVSMGDRHILFAQGSYFAVVLIARKPYNVLLSKAREFADKCQVLYDGKEDDEFTSPRTYEQVAKIMNLIFTPDTSYSATD